MSVLANVTAVAVNGRALLIQGKPGSGKSSLALALIDRGAVLIGDDAVTLSERADHCHVAPPPNIAGMLEIAGVGHITLATAEAPAALVLALDTAPARFPLVAAHRNLAGYAVPCLAFNAAAPAAALRAEYALQIHGLPFPCEPTGATRAP